MLHATAKTLFLHTVHTRNVLDVVVLDTGTVIRSNSPSRWLKINFNLNPELRKVQSWSSPRLA